MGSKNEWNAKGIHEFSKGCVHPEEFIRCLTSVAGLVCSRRLWIFAASIRHGRTKFTARRANLQKGRNEEGCNCFSTVALAFSALCPRKPESIADTGASGVESRFQQDFCAARKSGRSSRR